MTWTLHEGDCLAVLPTLPDASVDAVVTDPPYGCASGSKVCIRGKRIEAFNLEWDQSADWAWMAETARILRPGGSLVTFCNTAHTGDPWQACIAAGLRPAQMLAWTRHDPPPNPRRSFCSAFDVAVYAVRPGGERHWAGGGLTRNVFECSPSKGRDRWDYPHPTQKPLALITWLVGLVCPPGGLVLDPFAGSGTTGVAALELGRRFAGIEKDPGYCEMARRRIEAATAQGRLL